MVLARAPGTAAQHNLCSHCLWSRHGELHASDLALVSIAFRAADNQPSPLERLKLSLRQRFRGAARGRV